jgi:Ca-activated chloride channel family protein
LTDAATRPATAAGGLVTSSGETLALTAVTIDADVRIGGIAVTTRASFVNDLAEPLEVTYLCPLPAGFAPVGATCTIAGRTVRADLVARADAVRAHDDAIAEGRTAALAEQVGEELFAFAIGNIAADETATIQLTLVGTADVDDGQATLRLPLSTGQRYQPEGTAGRQPTRRGGVWREPTATVTVRTRGIEPTVVTHDADYETNGGEVTARLVDVALLGDVVVRWPAAAGWTAELTSDGDRGWLTVAATMGAPTERSGRDVVVLLDRSGSMGGWQMSGARSMANAIIDRLGPADRLCVLAFDTQLETAPGAAGFAGADAAYRRRLQTWLDTVDSRGGTELTRAFVTASGLVADSAGRATIVIVTDAEIGDEQRCISAIGMSSANVITVGIGDRVNRGLIAAIAEASGGWSTIVESPERLDEAVGDIAARCAGVAVPIESVAVLGADAVEWSGPSPRLSPGHQTVLRAEVRGTPTAVTVAGPGYRETVPVAADGPSFARQLWARARIATLLRGAATDEVEALRVALEAGVLCRLTAFVAVDPSGRQLDAVPVRMEVGHLDRFAPMSAMARGGAAAPTSGGRIMTRAKMIAGRPMRVVQARSDAAVAPAPQHWVPAPPSPGSLPAASPVMAPTAATSLAGLYAEIGAADLTMNVDQRSQALGSWAEQVASFLTGSDADGARALASRIAAAVVGGDAEWRALLAWAADRGAADGLR